MKSRCPRKSKWVSTINPRSLEDTLDAIRESLRKY